MYYYKGHVTSRTLWIYLIFFCLLSCNKGSFDRWPTFDFEINGIKAECKVACNQQSYSSGLRGVKIDKLYSSHIQAAGLCFVFPSDRIMVFSMEDVPFPLELVLVSSSGKVSYITTMAANSKKLYSSPEPARIALEFPVGFLQDTGIKTSDHLLSQQDINKLQKVCDFLR